MSLTCLSHAMLLVVKIGQPLLPWELHSLQYGIYTSLLLMCAGHTWLWFFQIVTECSKAPCLPLKLTKHNALSTTADSSAATRSQWCVSIIKLADLLHTRRNWSLDNTLVAGIRWIDGQRAGASGNSNRCTAGGKTVEHVTQSRSSGFQIDGTI